ncbi:hypothetical protein [Paenibacillus hamazuiensis]|uniref:hypothetical protein n=1 Tax=Paenibacillus hamazuiensis TaxID=2936508 RepID=UPI0020108E33|nr:hypothetical protein [Paenibacillus hamazuiensis]
MKAIIRKIAALPLLLALIGSLWGGFAAREAFAADPAGVELQIQAGFDGKIRDNRWFPVKFTITSPMEDMSGDLVLQMVNPTGGKDVTYVKHVDLPKMTAKTVWMTLPGTGMQLGSNNNVVKLYKGSVDKGAEVPIVKGKAYIETYLTQSTTVGVLARDPDTLNFLTLLNSRNYDVSVVYLNMADMPAESMMLDGLDAIALNDVASDQLKEEQVKAISGWIDRGGTLILAGGAGYAKTAKAFEAIAPAAYKDTVQVNGLSSLEKLAGKELPLASPFTVSRADVKAGSVVAQEGQIPLFVKKPQEKGAVWYVAYDLSLQPLASWPGNPMLWEKVLQNHLAMSNTKMARQVYPLMQQFWEVQNALDLFPSLNPPSFYMLLSLFIAYVVVVAPVLYLILKKLDKREWAWVIIPALSLVSSFGIFMIGASDRSSVLTHTLNTMELSGSGQGKRTTATAVFVPSGGKYEIELPKSAHALAFNNSRGPGGNGNLAGATDQYVYMDEGKTRLQWTDVPYWSVRKALLQEDSSEPLGKFEVKAGVDAGTVKGELKNATKSDLTDVVLFANRQLYRIGDLKAGETKPLGAPSTGAGIGYSDIGQLLYPYQGGRNGDDRNRERQMINMYANRNNFNGVNLSGKTWLIGWSKDEQFAYKVNGKEAKSDQLNMWVQEVQLDVVQGDNILIPYGYIAPAVVQSNVQHMGTDPMGQVYVGQGDFTFEYRLPDIEGASYHTLRMQSTGGLPAFLKLEIWNVGKNGWETLDLRQTAEFKDNVNQYLADGTAIRVKATTTQDFGFRYPDIALEGKVKQ